MCLSLTLIFCRHKEPNSWISSNFGNQIIASFYFQKTFFRIPRQYRRLCSTMKFQLSRVFAMSKTLFSTLFSKQKGEVPILLLSFLLFISPGFSINKPHQSGENATDDLTIIGQLVGTDINRIARVIRYHSAILMTRFEQFEGAYEALQQFVFENNSSPKVIEALGLSILRMPFLPSEYAPEKRELVVLAGQAAYEMADRRVESADRLFQELVSRYPNEPNVQYAYAVFLLGSDPDRAPQYFHRELMKNPVHVPSLLQICLELLRQGKPEEALPLATRASKLAPEFFTARKVLGRIFLETGEIKLAIQQLELGIQLAPNDREMHFSLSRAYARAGRKQDAAREQQEFLRLDRIFRSNLEGPQAVGGFKLPKQPQRFQKQLPEYVP